MALFVSVSQEWEPLVEFVLRIESLLQTLQPRQTLPVDIFQSLIAVCEVDVPKSLCQQRGDG